MWSLFSAKVFLTEAIREPTGAAWPLPAVLVHSARTDSESEVACSGTESLLYPVCRRNRSVPKSCRVAGLFPLGYSSVQCVDGNSLAGFTLLLRCSSKQRQLSARALKASRCIVILLPSLVLYLKGAAGEEQRLAGVSFLLLS